MFLINISPSNIFLKMLLLEKYMQNRQAFFGRSECEWANKVVLVIVHLLNPIIQKALITKNISYSPV